MRRSILPLLVLALGLFGCGGEDGPRETASLRVFHAGKGLPALRAGTDSGQLGTIGYGSATSYGTVSAMEQGVYVQRAQDDSDVLSRLVAFDPNTRTTIFIIGRGSVGGFPYAMRILRDRSQAPAQGQAAIRVFGAATTGPFDVYLTAPDADLAKATPTFTNIGYDFASGYQNRPATGSAVQVRVTPAGQKEPVLVDSSFSPSAGSIHTLVVLEEPVGSDVRLEFLRE